MKNKPNDQIKKLIEQHDAALKILHGIGLNPTMYTTIDHAAAGIAFLVSELRATIRNFTSSPQYNQPVIEAAVIGGVIPEKLLIVQLLHDPRGFVIGERVNVTIERRKS